MRGTDRLFLVWLERHSAIRIWANTARSAAEQFAKRKEIGDGSVIRVVSADFISTFRAEIGVHVTPFKEEYVN